MTTPTPSRLAATSSRRKRTRTTRQGKHRWRGKRKFQRGFASALTATSSWNDPRSGKKTEESAATSAISDDVPLTDAHMTTTEKTCFGEGKSLPLDAFYKHSNGRRTPKQGKECTKKTPMKDEGKKKTCMRRMTGKRKQAADDVRSYRAAKEKVSKAAHCSIERSKERNTLKPLVFAVDGSKESKGIIQTIPAPLKLFGFALRHRQLHASARKAQPLIMLNLTQMFSMRPPP